MTKNFILYLQFFAIIFFGLALAFICNCFFDYPVSSWFCAQQLNIIDKTSSVTKIAGEVETGLNDGRGGEGVGIFGVRFVRRLSGFVLMFEFFGHPLCFFVVLAVCFLLDFGRRCNLFRFIFCVLFSQSVVAAIKFSVLRKRPVINDFSISSFDLTGFVGRDDIHSFPSGHTALAVILALTLAWSYPRGRYLFYLLAVGVAFERVFDCRHYLSDTIIGALVAFTVWFFCYKSSFIANIFDNFESKINSEQSQKNQNNQPAILFGTTSLGSKSSKKFNSGIRQFLKDNDKPIDHNYQTETKLESKLEPEPEPAPKQTQPKNTKRSQKRNELPFNNFTF
ncbi:MAG: phosphatase PAP2 family protein [Planctomycetaceae bacterium]|jgi:membrane-associated phospholipid phosphatase|nr:phosphatase PAP2 family protein [Planctomycetaceae bacterium]